MKTCKLCHQTKPDEDFHKAKVNKDGSLLRKNHCKTCCNAKRMDKWHSMSKEQKQEYNRKNREKIGSDYFKEYRLKQKYGLTLEEHRGMMRSQNEKCSICKTKLTDENCRVDHHHESGKVRDLLCHHCNALIGFSREDVVIMKQAIEYLRKHDKVQED